MAAAIAAGGDWVGQLSGCSAHWELFCGWYRSLWAEIEGVCSEEPNPIGWCDGTREARPGRGLSTRKIFSP